MIIKHFVVGDFLSTNCYIFACKETRSAIVIDPGLLGNDGARILAEIGRARLSLDHIVCTHGHPDHTCGGQWLQEKTDANILIHERDSLFIHEPLLFFSSLSKLQTACPRCDIVSNPMVEFDSQTQQTILGCTNCGPLVLVPTVTSTLTELSSGHILVVGNHKLEVIHTPGHSPGGICLHSKELEIVFTGDTMFAGGRGRTDIPYSSTEDIERSIDNLLGLPEATVVYPGHGPQTTIGQEKRLLQK